MRRSQQELEFKLNELKSMGTEHEWLDFKHAETNFEFDKLGKYFSAISNEANLAGESCGWLVFGLEDSTLDIKGTNYLPTPAARTKIIGDIAAKLNTRSSFLEIHEYVSPEGRVLLFEIPAAPRNIPVEWKGFGYCREGESIMPLSTEKRERIRKQKPEDWSAFPAEGTTVDDLDEDAVQYLREKLSEVKKDKSYLKVPLVNLLNRLSLLTNGVPNNTALIFLGKTEVAKRYHPEVYKLAWKYEDKANNIVLRKIFEAPLIDKLELVQDEIERFNTQLADLDLFRRDIKQYDRGAIEELLINGLVHRDWSINLWNEIYQTPLEIRFTNFGIFHADLLLAITKNHRPPYSNPSMADFLQHINLMEREGGGLRRVYSTQLGRGVRVISEFLNNFDPPRVDFILKGKVENIDFAKLVLAAENEIEIFDLLLLDKIIGGKNKVGEDLTIDDAERLRQTGYIEIRGRKHRKCFVSATLADSIGKRGDYVRKKGFTKDQKITMIMNTFDEYGKVKMKDVYDLFPDDAQSSLRNLMKNLVDAGRIRRITPPGGRSEWYYVKVESSDDF